MYIYEYLSIYVQKDVIDHFRKSSVSSSFNEGIYTVFAYIENMHIYIYIYIHICRCICMYIRKHIYKYVQKDVIDHFRKISVSSSFNEGMYSFLSHWIRPYRGR
jgi:predicted secreted protein